MSNNLTVQELINILTHMAVNNPMVMKTTVTNIVEVKVSGDSFRKVLLVSEDEEKIRDLKDKIEDLGLLLKQSE